jgi:hypothetical protein
MAILFSTRCAVSDGWYFRICFQAGNTDVQRRSGCPCSVAGHSLRPSRPSLVRSCLRSAIHGSAGQPRRPSGHGHPSRNITRGFDPGRVGSGVGERSRSVGRILARRRDFRRPRAGDTRRLDAVLPALSRAKQDSPPWTLPANAGERQSTWATPKNANGFRGCQSPHPAAADFFHSLTGIAVGNATEALQRAICTTTRWNVAPKPQAAATSLFFVPFVLSSEINRSRSG